MCVCVCVCVCGVCVGVGVWCVCMCEYVMGRHEIRQPCRAQQLLIRAVCVRVSSCVNLASFPGTQYGEKNSSPRTSAWERG